MKSEKCCAVDSFAQFLYIKRGAWRLGGSWQRQTHPSGAKRAVRCMRQRSVLHRSLQRGACAVAARCISRLGLRPGSALRHAGHGMCLSPHPSCMMVSVLRQVGRILMPCLFGPSGLLGENVRGRLFFSPLPCAFLRKSVNFVGKCVGKMSLGALNSAFGGIRHVNEGRITILSSKRIFK